MSFLRNLRKQKVRFDFYIYVQHLSHLPTSLDGASLVCQFKRKDKFAQTKYCIASNNTARWCEPITFFSSLFTDKNPGEKPVFDSKTFTIIIKGVGEGTEKFKIDLDLASFVKMHSKHEVEHIIEFKDSDKTNQSTSNSPGPQLKLIIRSFHEGLSLEGADDFKTITTTSKFITPLNLDIEEETYMSVASPNAHSNTLARSIDIPARDEDVNINKNLTQHHERVNPFVIEEESDDQQENYDDNDLPEHSEAILSKSPPVNTHLCMSMVDPSLLSSHNADDLFNDALDDIKHSNRNRIVSVFNEDGRLGTPGFSHHNTDDALDMELDSLSLGHNNYDGSKISAQRTYNQHKDKGFGRFFNADGTPL